MRDDLRVQVYDRMVDPDFKHTIGQLKDGEAFCALGVVGDIAVQEGIAWWGQNVDWLVTEEMLPFGRTASLPPSLRRWAEVDIEESNRIAEFNDTHHGDPHAVAEFIKNEL